MMDLLFVLYKMLKVNIFFDDLVDNMYDIILNKRLLEPNFKLYQIIYRNGQYEIFDTKNKYIHT